MPRPIISKTLLPKKQHPESIPKPRAYLAHDLTWIYHRLVYRKCGNQSTHTGLTIFVSLLTHYNED